ncbi:MAG: chaperone NapD [Mariprofundaceae bacterium]|nr:chaperone NapD [Mariprofundaceae bacterium]
MSDEQQYCDEPVGCIVGAVVQLQVPVDDAVCRRLAACAGVEIHGQDKQSRLVITMEAETSREVMNLTEHIQNLDGVLYVTPVYQHCEGNQSNEKDGGWTWR